MNRSNISKQLNYGDLSRFVGKPVGQQFANKRYAEGDMVADELTESVVFEDVNGNKRTYNYNPKTHTKPNSSGRMRKINVDYTQLGNNPGINIFDQAQVTVDPIKTEGQQQDVPVSVAEDTWSGSDFMSDEKPAGALNTTEMLESMKAVNKTLPFISNVPYLGKPLAALARMGRDSMQETYRDQIGEENVPGLSGSKDTRDNKGNLVTGASLDKDFAGSKGKAEAAYKEGYKSDGTKGEKPTDADEKESGIAAFFNSLFGGASKDQQLNSIQNSIMMNYQDAYGKGSNLNEFGYPADSGDQGGGWGKASGNFGDVKAEIDAQEAAARAFNTAMDDFQNAVPGSDEEANAIGGMYSGVDDFSYGPMAAGGIAQLSSGGIAPSDKHLDPGSFVLSADVVSGVGDGSTEAGIERMSGLLGIPLDGSVDGPDGSMLGRVTTADGGPVPGTGLSDSVSTVIQDTGPIRLNVGNNPLKQMTPQGKTAARVARDELVVDTKTIANLPQMFMGTKGPDLKQGQEMLTNFMANVRANKTNTGGKQPGPLVPEGQDVMKGLASLFQRA